MLLLLSHVRVREVDLVRKLIHGEADVDCATVLHSCHVVSRSWWRWVQAADANDKAALQQLEDRLSMEEIAHFRAFVAAQSSKLLIKSETHLQHAVDAVDAVVANLGQLLPRRHMLYVLITHTCNRGHAWQCTLWHKHVSRVQ